MNVFDSMRIPRFPLDFTLDISQSIARQKRLGASTQPWHTPEVVEITGENSSPARTRDVVWMCKLRIRFKMTVVVLIPTNDFQRAVLSTEWKAAFR